MINNLFSRKPIIIAEIGWNFMGDIKLAKKMINAAKKCGADAVKFQIWNPEYLKKGSWDKDGRIEIYNKAKLSIDTFLQLKKYCKIKKITCFTSVFSMNELIDLSKKYNQIVKIPSHEAYDIKLILEASKRFKYVLLSVGALTKKELLKICNLKKKNIIPMHCVSCYPLSAKNCNFPKLEFLKTKFKYVGYSGHYEGFEDAVIALSKGCTVIEKHFTINNNLPGRDNKFALNEKKLKELCSWSKLIYEMNMSHGLGLQKAEKDIFKNYRGRWQSIKKRN